MKKEWKKISERLPYCFERGNWDGLRSNFLLVVDKHGMFYVARLYNGIIDGCEFACWYDNNDYELDNIVMWIELPKLPNE